MSAFYIWNPYIVSHYPKALEFIVTNGDVVDGIANDKELQERYKVSTPTFSRSEVLRKYKQLQINLGKFPSRFYSDGADYAERVIEICEKAKGIVHYEDR